MTSVPRLIHFWESMSLSVTPLAVLPERSVRGSVSESPSGTFSAAPPPQPPLTDRQSGETFASVSEEPGEVLGGSCRARSQEQSRRGYVVKRNTLFSSRENFWDFPYRSAGRFRENLLSKRKTYDVDYVLTEVSARLGPAEVDPLTELNEWIENGLTDEITPGIRSSNPYTVLEDQDDVVCSLSRSLGGKAKQLVGWFAGFGLTKIQDPPASIQCGGLRSAVRQCFSDVDLIWELSFKTITKIERSCCKSCLPRFEEKLDIWKTARIRPQPVDDEHLKLFRKAFARNVDQGWDARRRPFIPNGNATLNSTRRDGGNWNEESLSENFRTELVFASGKPRIVTLYSSKNTEVLIPLHHSLYAMLKKKGWLLVGEPTNKHIQKLNGAELLSFDYSSATDNIKTDYVRSAIDVLISRADVMSDEELECLRILGNLSIDGVVCGSGQPMGSAMSFPLLCLINKTVVDMSMDRLLIGKEISFLEWSKHSCLINGDDLLIREVRKNTNLRGLIAEEGNKVGLVVNFEKTMSSDTECEINSTLFSNGNRVRKFNASAVWMDPGVEDVLGFAAQSSHDVKTFRKLVRWNANILAKSSDKHLSEIPAHLQVVCRKDKKIRRAITSLPRDNRPKLRGVIRMEARPHGYYLEASEESCSMREEIKRCREMGVAWSQDRATRKQFHTVAEPNRMSYSQVLKLKKIDGQELIPACYVRTYVNKIKDALVEDSVAGSSSKYLPLLYPEGGTRISNIIDNLRLFNQERAVWSSGTMTPDFGQEDFVRLD